MGKTTSDQKQRTVDNALISIIVPTVEPACMPTGFLLAIQKQSLPHKLSCEVIIVNDGGDPQFALPKTANVPITVTHNSIATGRAAARNKGVENAKGAWLYFLDADCVLADANAISAHLASINNSADISIGKILSTQDGFWSKFRDTATKSVSTALDVNKLTTANCLMTRRCFEDIEGYKENYRGYGFEDRDLLARALLNGAIIQVTPGAQALHEDEQLSVMEYCEKMNEAARITAPIFCNDHPNLYMKSRYAIFDARLKKPAVRRLIILCEPIALWIIRCCAVLPHIDWLPFWFRKRSLNLAGGLSYLLGSVNIELKKS